MGALIAVAWFALLAGFVGGAAYVGFRQAGAQFVTRRFWFELAVITGWVGFILYGFPLIGVAVGFGAP